ncbi:MAG: hypothetical protein ACRD3E_06325 [Terriglobales bacterium]
MYLDLLIAELLESGLHVGDELRQVTPLVTHSMAYVGPIGPNGEDVLNAPKGGVATLMHLAEVIKDGPVTIGERGPQTWAEQVSVQQRALQARGTPNRLVETNCEHITHWVRTGRKKSPQLQFAVGFAVVAAIAIWG